MEYHLEPPYAHLRAFMESLPERFAQPAADEAQTGRALYCGRNELRVFRSAGLRLVVKSFCRPNLVNRVAYGLLRPSKAERSCRWALRLRALGIDSPAPVGWCQSRRGLLLAESYYVSLESQLPYTYINMVRGTLPSELRGPLLLLVGRTAARMHQAGLIHRDFSRGNLLLGIDTEGAPRCELVDLNRIRRRRVSLAEGVAGFQRLPSTPEMRALMAEGYARERGVEPGQVLALWPECEAMDSPEAYPRQ